MNVSEVMSRAIFAVAPDTGIEAAARLFIRNHIGGAPVIDGDGKPIGFVTSKDLLDPDRRHSDRRGQSTCYRLGSESASQPIELGPVRSAGVVADVMTQFIMSVPGTMALEEAARMMLASDLHRVLVFDETRAIAGILSSFDVMRALTPGS